MSKTNVFFYGVLVLFSFLFWLKGSTELDPDFGWHLKAGQLILEKGIPKTDPFSYTMPSYPFVDHEWLTNVIIAITYPYLQLKGLAVVFSLLALFSLLIHSSGKEKKWALVPLVLGLGVLYEFVGVRPQVITWLFFSILIKLLFDKKLWQKYGVFVPLLLLLWVNLHGGFAVGIVILFVYMSIHFAVERKLNKKDVYILLFSALATFINPFSYLIWWEVWMQISDTSLRWSIAEWQPTFIVLNLAIWFTIAFSSVIVFISRKELLLKEILLFIFLLLAGLSSVRHIPLWVYISFPLLIKIFMLFTKKTSQYSDGSNRWNKAYKILVVIISIWIFVPVVMGISTTKSLDINDYDSSYPRKAVGYLKLHFSSGNIFALYDWGGYLIWKLPEKKVFVDGRMASWRWKSPYRKESDNAFKEFKDVMHGTTDIEKVFEKYNIDTIVLSNKKSKSSLLDILENWIEIHISKRKNKNYSFIQNLIRKKWIKVYEDEIVVIYIKS